MLLLYTILKKYAKIGNKLPRVQVLNVTKEQKKRKYKKY